MYNWYSYIRNNIQRSNKRKLPWNKGSKYIDKMSTLYIRKKIVTEWSAHNLRNLLEFNDRAFSGGEERINCPTGKNKIYLRLKKKVESNRAVSMKSSGKENIKQEC